MIHPAALIHHLAHIDETATVGPLSRVWQFASVIRRAVIGEQCNIASASIVDGARIGNRCIVGHGAFAGPGTEIEDDVFIGPGAIACNDAWPRVTKDDFDMTGLIDGSIVTVRIQRGASIGAGAVILPGITVGMNAMVAAGATVTRNVPHDFLWKRDGTAEGIDPEAPMLRIRRA